MSVDLGSMYRAARERITGMVSDDVAHVRVAATPDWDVHDVVAHLAGIVEDALSDNMAGVTTDPWTAAQVERARHLTVSELVARWNEQAPFVEGFLSSPEGASRGLAVVDLHTHECDLLTALGRPLAVPSDVLGWIAGQLRTSFDAAVTEAGLPPVTVDVSDLELFRGRLGRRTRDEVCALDWSAEPEPYLEHWFVFGVAEQPLGERVES